MQALWTYEKVGSIAYILCEILMIGLKSSKLDLFLFSSVINKKHRVLQWIGAIERTMAYISFFLDWLPCLLIVLYNIFLLDILRKELS